MTNPKSTSSTPTPSLVWDPDSSQTSDERERQADRQRNRETERDIRKRRKQIM